MARNCNQCAALGKECAAEPDDRARAAENCPCYSDDAFLERPQNEWTLAEWARAYEIREGY